MADDKSPLQQSIEGTLQGNLKSDGRIDPDKLRQNNPPLAEVLDEFVASKTVRDEPTMFAKDLARTIEARDPNSRLADALKKLEDHLKK